MAGQLPHPTNEKLIPTYRQVPTFSQWNQDAGKGHQFSALNPIGGPLEVYHKAKSPPYTKPLSKNLQHEMCKMCDYILKNVKEGHAYAIQKMGGTVRGRQRDAVEALRDRLSKELGGGGRSTIQNKLMEQVGLTVNDHSRRQDVL